MLVLFGKKSDYDPWSEISAIAKLRIWYSISHRITICMSLKFVEIVVWKPWE